MPLAATGRRRTPRFSMRSIALGNNLIFFDRDERFCSCRTSRSWYRGPGLWPRLLRAENRILLLDPM